MDRDRLRRVSCGKVFAHAPGGEASLLLLKRHRTSLVPFPVGSLEDAAAKDAAPKDSARGGAIDEELNGTAGTCAERSWRDVCPGEGDRSEPFSRFVRAKLRCEE